MVKDRLRQLIGQALAGSASRDELSAILRQLTDADVVAASAAQGEAEEAAAGDLTACEAPAEAVEAEAAQAAPAEAEATGGEPTGLEAADEPAVAEAAGDEAAEAEAVEAEPEEAEPAEAESAAGASTQVMALQDDLPLLDDAVIEGDVVTVAADEWPGPIPTLFPDDSTAGDALDSAADQAHGSAGDSMGAGRRVNGAVAGSSERTIASLKSIVDCVKDAILTVDEGGYVRSSNFAAERLFRESADWFCRQTVKTLLPELGEIDRSLQSLAGRLDDTSVDLSPELAEAVRADGSRFQAEVTISRIEYDDDVSFALSIRDVTERFEQLRALGDSEARYRALVENAPEAIVVLDVDKNVFIDANDNASRLFKLSRKQLLSIGPSAISPARQFDGLPSFGLERGYIERALKGGCPVFEWLHCDAQGNEIPCEVRFIRLPSSHRKLIRASVIDIAERRRADALAFGERRVLELVAANAHLDRTLQAVLGLAEQLQPGCHAAVMLLDAEQKTLRLAAANKLPEPFRGALREIPIALNAGTCASAVSLRRQIIAADIESDPTCGDLRELAAPSGLHACFSTPIEASGERILGTFAIYFSQQRNPRTEELDLATRLAQLAGIAIKRKHDEDALRVSESRFRALFDNVVDGVFQATPDEQLISANPALLSMLGYERFEDLGDHCMSDFCVNLRDRDRLNDELAAHGRVRNYEYRLRRANGEILVVIENSRTVKDDAGCTVYVEGTITDVTQRKAAERALFREKERAQVTLQSIGDAVVTTDAGGYVEYLNPVAEELTGWESRAAQGKRIDEVIELRDEISDDRIEDPVLRCLEENRVVTLTENAVLVAHNGNTIAIQDSAAPIQDRRGNVVGAVMVFHDVSRERQLHRKLSYYATHDSLTGLINRREFEEKLSTTLRMVKSGVTRASALLCMDLDQFKVVNDTCGHSAGDLLLRQLAEVLQGRVRVTDVLARLGGDEFAVLLEDCPVDRAAEIADQLRESISQFRFGWRDSSMQVGVSIGIVPLTKNSDSVASLMSAADVACYVAKDLGRNRLHVYEEGDASERHQEMQWVARINSAREEDRFELFFQPIVPIGETVDDYPQFELLLRMRDEHDQLVGPSAFIPAAERYNLMPSLDRWVIHEVLESLVYREQPGTEPHMLAVNLSGTTLNDAKFLDFLLAELSTAHVPDGALCFEITETAAIANLGAVVRFMRKLKDRGCRFSLDDFGTGLSSLTYLKNLPVDYVKIDGQFIRNVIRDRSDESVVDAIARMARALNVYTIAERVESRAVLTRLGELGISYAQGFFIAVPRPVSELPVRAPDKGEARSA